MINFDFEGEIQELVELVSMCTGRNFILTNKVRSQKFKIISPTPIRSQNLWRVFLAALEANDFTVVPSGRYWKVIQANDGTRSPVPFYEAGESLRGKGRTFPVDEQMVTKVYRVKHGGNTNNIVNYLNIFKSNRGQLHPFQGSNLIIMTDYASSLARLERILAELDQPDVLEKIHVVSVTYASATEIAEKLTQIFEPQNPQARKAGGNKRTPRIARPNARNRRQKPKPRRRGGERAAGDEGSDGSVSKILADERTNKLIIIASESAYEEIVALLRQLDVPEDVDDGQIHVLRLRHADAEELASTLSSLAQGQSGGARRQSARRGGGNQPQRRSAAALFQGEVKVTADKATNSLVITASKSDLASMRRVIERLDVPRFQVFVEAAILEVSTSRDRNLGVGWHLGVPVELDGETSPLIFSNTPSNDLSSLVNTINPLGLANLLGLATALRGPTLEGTEGLPGVPQGGIPSVGVVLQALQSSNDVNVVSTPHLLTMDNEEAEIQVNEKRPFPSGLTLGLGGLGGLGGAGGQQAGGAAAGAVGNLAGLGLGQVSFNREDIGLTLKIKPQINDEDYVRLEIDQELSDVAGIDQVTNQVITSKRSAKTTVVVRSQDSVVIGGLVRDRETRDESKLPVLGDIPLIGWLFKRQNKTVEKVNLVLVLTPYIIRGPKDFRKIFERKMQERKEFVDLFYGQTKEYRAKIDWDQKLGPIAAYRQAMRRELRKAENDGPGLPGQVIIRPRTDEGEAADDVEEEGAAPEPAPPEQGTEPPPPPEALEGDEPPEPEEEPER
jgi:general secretion pathway protein D